MTFSLHLLNARLEKISARGRVPAALVAAVWLLGVAALKLAAADAPEPTQPLPASRNPVRLDSPFNTSASAGDAPKADGTNLARHIVNLAGINWAKGPGVGAIPNAARIKIEAGMVLTDPAGTHAWLQLQELAPQESEVGLIIGPRAAWNALVTLFPPTNASLADWSAKLTELAPEALAQLNQPAPGVTTNAARLTWSIPPRFVANGGRLEWSLAHEEAGRVRVRPGAAFATARGLVVFRFFGPDDTSEEDCFSLLRGVTVTHPAAGPFAPLPGAADLAQLFWDARVLEFRHPWETDGRRVTANPVGTVFESPAAARRPKTRVELPPPAPAKREFGSEDLMVVGLLAVAAVVALVIGLGTRTRQNEGKGRRRSRRGSGAPANTRPAGVTLASIGITGPPPEPELPVHPAPGSGTNTGAEPKSGGQNTPTS
jgi:hypothetical protein